MKNKFARTLCAVAAAATVMTIGTAALAQKRADEPVQTIPAMRNLDPAMVELGKKLYFDPRLSATGTVSCFSCHNVMEGGDDTATRNRGLDMGGHTSTRRQQWLELAGDSNQGVRHADDDFSSKRVGIVLDCCRRRIPRRGDDNQITR